MGAGTGAAWVGKRPPWLPTLEKIRVGMAHHAQFAHPGNFSRGLKTYWQ